MTKKIVTLSLKRKPLVRVQLGEPERAHTNHICIKWLYGNSAKTLEKDILRQ